MNTNNTTSTPTKIVAYYRVSTKKQGLGLEAQRAIVEQYATDMGATIVEEFEEKESGKECDRPTLNLAMATARKQRASLVVAKADRLSRDLSFAAQVFFKSGINVVALNLPEEAMSDRLMFGVYFGLAEQEAKLISQRTRAALAALKAKGVKLGRPNAEITPEMRQAAANARKENADNNPANLAAAAELRRYFDGATKRNLSAAARHLNEKQLYTPRGVFHDAKSVKLLIARYDI
ncbi:MAG: recombinase family protein [Lachnospiraceae bacterium]|nr:recombinase family protein [Lachnospiraceae bacterium]